MLKNEKKLGAASYKAPGMSVIPVSSAEVLCQSTNYGDLGQPGSPIDEEGNYGTF